MALLGPNPMRTAKTLHQKSPVCASSSSSRSSSASTSNSSASLPEVEQDKPIGYGAFGVVWSVTDPRDSTRVALKKMPNVFQNLVAARRVYRELSMLCHLKHDNVISCLDILQPSDKDFFQELYVLTELMQSDLHKIIVSPQPLTPDHVKVFLYQLLRGLKYLHAARIIHRDVKPGNLLVNSNCCLKICDFGLARVSEVNTTVNLTQEVVTQYYRAPEILLGARHYNESIDMWSAGCIFAELLSRKIIFQAPSPLEQVDKIIDLLGTPSIEEIRTSCSGAKTHVRSQPFKNPQLHRMYNLSTSASHDCVHLLCKLLVFDPERRATAAEALAHPYLEEGRLRYHSCMCSCCSTGPRGRVFCDTFEPLSQEPFPHGWESDLTNIHQIREKLKALMLKKQGDHATPLCINPNSVSFKQFQRSTVAQPSELPPSPHRWDR